MRPRARRLVATAAAALVTGTVLQAAGTTAHALSAGPVAPVEGTAPADYDFLRAQVFTAPGLGTIAVGMPSARRVMVQRLDPSTRTWTRPTTLFFEKGVTCGEIEGRTSAGGIALLLACDRPYYEDQAPAHSIAAVTRDLRSWATATLPGEAYTAPGISPSGQHAVWPAGGIGDFVTWSASGGFSALRSTSYDDDSGGPSAVVSDDGMVTLAGPDHVGRRCVVSLRTVAPSGLETVQYVDHAPGAPTGCTEMIVDGESSTRVTSGRRGDRADYWVIGRADEASPWTLLQRAPAQAPGLLDHRGAPRRAMDVRYSDVAAQPLVALASPDRRRVTAQVYDEVSQSWGPARVVYDHGFPGCAWGSGFSSRTYAVHNLLLHCYPKKRPSGDYPPFDDDFDVAPDSATRALLSVDGTTWRMIPMGSRPVTAALDGSVVAAGRARSTTLVSSGGFRRVPAGAPGRCEAVFPIGPARLLRLDATRRSDGFPSRLQRLASSGWRTIGRIPSLGAGECRAIETADFGAPGTFYLRGSERSQGLRIVRGADGWRAVPTRGL